MARLRRDSLVVEHFLARDESTRETWIKLSIGLADIFERFAAVMIELGGIRFHEPMIGLVFWPPPDDKRYEVADSRSIREASEIADLLQVYRTKQVVIDIGRLGWDDADRIGAVKTVLVMNKPAA
jgi:hypothetical protein